MARRAAAWSTLILLAALGAGCAGPRFRSVDYRAATARALADPDFTDPGDGDQSLAAFDVITVASMVPEPTAVASAMGVIEENAGAAKANARGIASIVTIEGVRLYIGETFERAYANTVAGWAYWTMGQRQNAAALWRNAALTDRESDRGFQEDFGPAYYLLSRWYARLPRGADNLEYYRSRFLKTHPNAAHLVSDEALRTHNLVVLVENGRAPRKETYGPAGQLVRYGPERKDFDHAVIEVDGTPLGRTTNVFDVRLNAEHSIKADTKDAVQATKGTVLAAGAGYGAYKITDDPVLGALVFFFLMDVPDFLGLTSGDRRQWLGVPAEFHAFSAKVPEGTHEIVIRPVDARGSAIASQRVRYASVTVAGEAETILLVRPMYGYTERTLPPPKAQARIAADRKAAAAPNAPRIGRSAVDPDDWKRNPLYRHLPPAED